MLQYKVSNAKSPFDFVDDDDLMSEEFTMRHLFVIMVITCQVAMSCKHRGDSVGQGSDLASAKGKEIYVDMDGVLTDFLGEYKARADKDFEKDPENWANINRWGEAFWSGMKPMPDREKLWNFVKPFNPTILTSCGRVPSVGCESGKKKWVAKNLGQKVKVIIRFDKEFYAHPNAILIDDMRKYLDPWEKKGIGIWHKSADESIENLKAIMEGRINKEL